ncbi:MAG: fumarate hydratase [Proteobacteria bacterium]|nr:fumarate hydratase [Pseudomonadota bacterium]
MKTIRFDDIVKKVKDACMSANFELGEDVITAFRKTKETEESPVGKEILEQLIENATIAKEEKIAMCQDTGFAVFFVEIGDEVKVSGGNLVEAINEGVRQGYKEGYLRKSICHPFTRKNTGDNTPAIVHLDMVPGDQLKIIVAPKGGGSENMSRVTMLKPSDGIEGIKRFVIERVRESGANPCPPLVIGVGIGGTFEKAALIAKKALLRPVGSKNPDPELVSLEEELLVEINNLGVGPQGLGGRTTALAVHVNMHPCHIASLPVAVNINCHASRHKEIVL